MLYEKDLHFLLLICSYVYIIFIPVNYMRSFGRYCVKAVVFKSSVIKYWHPLT